MSRRVRVAAMTGLLGLALAGCGAGQTAFTAQNMPSVPGVSVTEAGIAVRNATVEYSLEGYPAGADTPIRLMILNETVAPVRLVGLTSPAAGAVTLVEAVQVGAAAVEPELPAEPVEPGQPGQVDLELAPGTLFAVTLQASGLHQPLDGTETLPVELTFDNEVVLTLTVPMAPPLEPLPREEPLDVGHH